MFEELNAISIKENDRLVTGSGLHVIVHEIEIVSDDRCHVEIMVTYLAWNEKPAAASRCKCNYESFCNLIRS